jgi:hypothetical protein
MFDPNVPKSRGRGDPDRRVEIHALLR